MGFLTISQSFVSDKGTAPYPLQLPAWGVHSDLQRANRESRFSKEMSFRVDHIGSKSGFIKHERKVYKWQVWALGDSHFRCLELLALEWVTWPNVCQHCCFLLPCTKGRGHDKVKSQKGSPPPQKSSSRPPQMAGPRHSSVSYTFHSCWFCSRIPGYTVVPHLSPCESSNNLLLKTEETLVFIYEKYHYFINSCNSYFII